MLLAGLGVQPQHGAPRGGAAPAGRGAARKPQTRPGSCSGGIAVSHGASSKSTENIPAADAPPLKKNPSVKDRSWAGAEDGARGAEEAAAGEEREGNARVGRKEQL